jgi:DNA modification methylase
MAWPEWTSPDGRIRLICGDALEVRDSLPPIDAVIADPPYGMNWNTDSKRFTGGKVRPVAVAGLSARRAVGK